MKLYPEHMFLPHLQADTFPYPPLSSKNSSNLGLGSFNHLLGLVRMKQECKAKYMPPFSFALTGMDFLGDETG